MNRAAAAAEADAYLLLGSHPLVARCLFIAPSKTYIELEYYPAGNLAAYMRAHHGDFTNAQLVAFAGQMLESVAYMHSKGICHSALRLEAWLLDPTGTLRLSDFNNAAIPVHPLLRVPARPSLVLEQPSHCMPRMYTNGPGSTVASDIFALGSSLYELVSRRGPYEGEGLSLADYWKLYQERKFPDTEGKPLSKEIKKCWMGEYGSVQDILRDLQCSM
ncbi:kinase-like protein [Pyrenochaeta sp. DS3sAY3a]|nr:kinase-like protein [Pyrenochaeta sp. DS3sAY3a]